MKIFILIFCFFCFNMALGQNDIVVCKDTIKFLSQDDSLIFEINDKTIKIKASLLNQEDFKTKFSIECIDEGFDLIFSRQQGNEYQVYHNLFYRNEKGKYFLGKQYGIFSNRYEYTIYGALVQLKPLEDFALEEGFFKSENIEIQHVTGFQEGKEIVEVPFYGKVERLYKNKKYKEVLLSLNPFVVNEVKIWETENIANLNNLGFYAYKSGGYKEAVYILNKVINIDPQRAVAYLNIADCEWELGNKDKAAGYYKKYISLMKEQKKEMQKIPAYVHNRS